MAKNKENFLDYIPRHNKNYDWSVNKDGIVEVKMENTGITNRIAQKFFRKPRYSYIKLDAPGSRQGSFVWKQIDGKRNIYEIGQLVKEEFGEEAEPLYERLSQFIKTMHQQKFVVYENKIQK